MMHFFSLCCIMQQIFAAISIMLFFFFFQIVQNIFMSSRWAYYSSRSPEDALTLCMSLFMS